MSHRHGVVYVKLPLAAKIEKPKSRIASLLDFSDDESWSDRMDRAGRDENHVPRVNVTP